MPRKGSGRDEKKEARLGASRWRVFGYYSKGMKRSQLRSLMYSPARESSSSRALVIFSRSKGCIVPFCNRNGNTYPLRKRC